MNAFPLHQYDETAQSHANGAFQKDISLKPHKLAQIHRRLLALGFIQNSGGRYVNLSRGAKIQEIAFTPDRLDTHFIWLIVRSNKAFLDAAGARARFAKRRQMDLERKLCQTKEYWRRSVHPHIADRALRGVELYVANDAFSNLKAAQKNAASWNASSYGHRFPVSDRAFADLNGEEFFKPQELCASEDLKPETLAAIAAPMMGKRAANLTPFGVIGVAHELLLAAQRYVDALPERKHTRDRIAEEFGRPFSTVAFEEIEASGKPNSGQMPLLPAVWHKRKGEEETEMDPPLSVAAIRAAVKQFLIETTPRLSRLEYELRQEQERALEDIGVSFPASRGRLRTYEEWHADNQRAVDDCMENGRISLQHLCQLRRQRFEKSVPPGDVWRGLGMESEMNKVI